MNKLTAIACFIMVAMVLDIYALIEFEGGGALSGLLNATHVNGTDVPFCF